jgi:hypothetical protein
MDSIIIIMKLVVLQLSTLARFSMDHTNLSCVSAPLTAQSFGMQAACILHLP